MDSKTDGTDDGLAAFRKAFGDEEARTPPHHEHRHAKEVTLIAIDEFTEPSSRCPNGHIAQWVVKKGTPDEARINILARYPRAVLLTDSEERDPNFVPTPVCATCGEDGINAEEANGS
jgi:hypothetical protein